MPSDSLLVAKQESDRCITFTASKNNVQKVSLKTKSTYPQMP